MVHLVRIVSDWCIQRGAKRSPGNLLVVILMGGLISGCAGSSSKSGATEPLEGSAEPSLITPPVTSLAPQPAAFDVNGNPYIPGSTELLNRTFHFEYDRSVLKPDDLASLKTHARTLLNNPNHSVAIEGHADERGTRGYNLALGERRANAVRLFLISTGVSSEQIETVSYGEERPEDSRHSDAAWSRNRRAFMIYHHRGESNELAHVPSASPDW